MAGSTVRAQGGTWMTGAEFFLRAARALSTLSAITSADAATTIMHITRMRVFFTPTL